MKVEQIYTGCLAHAAYYIESKGEAAIFDPLREVQPYLDRARADNAKIKYIFETHFHADFVSGHLDLRKKTGAQIVFGPNANPGYEALIAEDGQDFTVGDYRVKAIHTPGHTLESTTYLLIDAHGEPHGIITGDTLFIGDVGRPDLAQHLVSDLTEEKLASLLYDSLRNKIMPLPDDLIVYPNHGAGSACGKKMSKETTDTLGNQKKTNYALRADMTKAEFIQELLEGLTAPPAYFPQNVLMNIQGYESLDSIMEQGARPLDPDAFEAAANETGAVVLDVRDKDDFARGHVPRSIFIGLDGSFAPWVGALLADTEQPILLIAPEGQEEEAVIRLSRVGFDKTLGYLKGGFDAWKEASREYDVVSRIRPDELKELMEAGDVSVLDVRKEAEYQAEHLEGAENIPLRSLNDSLQRFSDSRIHYLHCGSGYRSLIAVSVLKSRGFHNLVDIQGGFEAMVEAGLPVTDYVCPSTLKEEK